MLKKLIIAAGLLASSLLTSQAAQAAAHRAYSHRGHVAVHASHLGRSRFVGRLRAGAYRTVRLGTPHRYGRLGLARRGYAHRGHIRHYAYGHARHGRRFAHGHFGRHYARRGARYAAVPRDTAIQNYVGPATGYTPASTAINGQVGGASYYSGGRTASGGSVGAATCAHRSLPFGTKVLVTNLTNARQAVLTVNDRGPFIGGRIVDVSRTAAGTLGMLGSGVARVSLKVIGGPG